MHQKKGTRLQPNNEQFETVSKIDSMETDDSPHEYFSKSDSEKSEVDVGEEHLDLIIAIDKSGEHNMKMQTNFLSL